MSGGFQLVQPFGKDRARETTTISSHATAEEAFAEIDRLSERMVDARATRS